MSKIKGLTKKQLFLPIFSMILVMLVNVIYCLRQSAVVFLPDRNADDDIGKYNPFRTSDRCAEPRQ